MRNLFLICFFVFSFFGFSQEEKKSIYFPQEQLIHPDCLNEKDKNACFYQNLEDTVYQLLNKKERKKEISKFKKDTLRVRFTLILDANGLLEKETSSTSVNNKKLYNKLKPSLQKELFGLPKFEIQNRKNDPIVSRHYLTFKYLVKKENNEVQLKHLSNKKPYKGGIIEEVPIFPGCENLPQPKARKCFNKMMQLHIHNNFNYPKLAQKKKISGKVFVMFTIDKEGKQTKIRLRGPHPLLEEEAERIIKLLPIVKPGLQNGKPVRVPFSIPITFKLK